MVTIRLFGMMKSLAKNQGELSVSLNGGHRVKDLVAVLDAEYPQIGELVHKKKVLVSVNQDIAHEDVEIKDGDEIALLPPFAGGSSQDVETGRQLCSRIAQGLDVPNSVRLAASLAAASLDSQCERPAKARHFSEGARA